MLQDETFRKRIQKLFTKLLIIFYLDVIIRELQLRLLGVYRREELQRRNCVENVRLSLAAVDRVEVLEVERFRLNLDEGVPLFHGKHEIQVEFDRHRLAVLRPEDLHRLTLLKRDKTTF